MNKDHHLVTFAVISYNQELYIAEAVQSALAQTYSPLEIVISDDGSTDATFEVIQQIVANYSGPHKVILQKNQPNLGLAGNVNRVWELSSGDLVVFQGGDDISLPQRTEKLVTEWLSHDPRPDLVFSGVTLIDKAGKPIGQRTGLITHSLGVAETVTGTRPFVAGGCAAAYARQLHCFVGPLNNGVIAEDFVYSFRALLGNGVAGLPDLLVNYRQHDQSIIGELLQSKAQGVPSKKFLQGHLALLFEYERAMKAHQTKSFYLRWRLGRRIASTERELNILQARNYANLSTLIWSMVTFRLRFALTQLKRILLRKYLGAESVPNVSDKK